MMNRSLRRMPILGLLKPYWTFARIRNARSSLKEHAPRFTTAAILVAVSGEKRNVCPVSARSAHREMPSSTESMETSIVRCVMCKLCQLLPASGVGVDIFSMLNA